MTYITPGSDPLCRLSDALGLERCREATLRMAVNDVVTLTATTCATVGQAENLVEVIKQASVVWWIPVGERLPEEYETVLVATNGGVSAGEIRLPDGECGMSEPWWMVFKDQRETAIAWAGFVSLGEVTHWMPLPEPPT